MLENRRRCFTLCMTLFVIAMCIYVQLSVHFEFHVKFTHTQYYLLKQLYLAPIVFIILMVMLFRCFYEYTVTFYTHNHCANRHTHRDIPQPTFSYSNISGIRDLYANYSDGCSVLVLAILNLDHV